jgi:hypothetical protein
VVERFDVQVIKQEMSIYGAHDKDADELLMQKHTSCVLWREGLKEPRPYTLGIEPTKRLKAGLHSPGPYLCERGAVFFTDWAKRDERLRHGMRGLTCELTGTVGYGDGRARMKWKPGRRHAPLFSVERMVRPHG